MKHGAGDYPQKCLCGTLFVSAADVWRHAAKASEPGA